MEEKGAITHIDMDSLAGNRHVRPDRIMADKSGGKKTLKSYKKEGTGPKKH